MNDRTGSAQRTIKSSAYSVYGYLGKGIRGHRLGYNGQLLDCVVQGYLLGNGNRIYSPVLMRFCSPDVLSPFKAGGVNAYVYCGGDPVNFIDPKGSNRFAKNWTAFEPVFKKINNTKFRVQGFSYNPAAPEGKRIQPFRAKSVNGITWDRPDPDAELSGQFYVDKDRSLFISENFVLADDVGTKPLVPTEELINQGFTLLDVNPTHIALRKNGQVKPGSNVIFINSSGMTDYSKQDLTMPGLAAAIRKGRPGTPPLS